MDDFNRASGVVAAVVMPVAAFQSPVLASARRVVSSRLSVRIVVVTSSGVASTAWKEERESVESNEFNLDE